MKKATTLRELARAAGVSVGTASQAMRNDSNSSRATCLRIQELARKLGYRPDPVLARLASKRFQRSRKREQAPVIFVTHGDPAYVAQGMRYSSDLRQQLEVMGYAYRHVQVESLEHLRQGARQWHHQGALGVIFGIFREVEWIQEVDWLDFSVIFLGGTCPVPFLHTVKADVSIGMEMALARALATTEGRVGVVLHQHGVSLQDDRLREGMARNFLAQLPSGRGAPLLLQSFDTPMLVQRKRVEEWMQRHQPDRVVGFALLEWTMQNAGLFAENSGSFFPVIQDAPARRPGAVEPTAREAQQALQWIDTMIRHGERGVPEHPLNMMVPPEWSDGPV